MKGFASGKVRSLSTRQCVLPARLPQAIAAWAANGKRGKKQRPSRQFDVLCLYRTADRREPAGVSMRGGV